MNLQDQIKGPDQFDQENPQPGVYRIDNEVYHRSKGLSASFLKRVLISWKHAQTPFKGDTASIKKGTILHAAALEPKLFSELYSEIPEAPQNTKEGVIRKADFLLEKLGMTWDNSPETLKIDVLRLKIKWLEEEAAKKGYLFLPPSDLADLRSMIKEIHEHPTAPLFLKAQGALPELSFFGYIEIDGHQVLVKVRPDLMVPSRDGKSWNLVSLKSTKDASPHGFARQFAQMNYHLAESLYNDLLTGHFGLNLYRVVIIAQENKEPYCCEVYNYPEDAYIKGVLRYQQSIRKVLYHRANPEAYAGYSGDGGLQNIYLPEWA